MIRFTLFAMRGALLVGVPIALAVGAWLAFGVDSARADVWTQNVPGPYTYSPPAGANVVKVEALGGGGGGGDGAGFCGGCAGANAVGGAGARVTAFRSVESSVSVYVGGGGHPDGTCGGGGGSSNVDAADASRRVIAGGGGGGATYLSGGGGVAGGSGGAGGNGFALYGPPGYGGSGGTGGASGGGELAANGGNGAGGPGGGGEHDLGGGAGSGLGTGGNKGMMGCGGGGGGFGGGGGGDYGGGAGGSVGPSPAGLTVVAYAPASNGGAVNGNGGDGSVTITALERAGSVAAVGGEGSAVVTWSAVTQPAGVGTVTYTVYRDGVEVVGATSSPVTVTGLASGTTYAFTVVATTTDGLRTTSVASSATTASAASDAPASGGSPAPSDSSAPSDSAAPSGSSAPGGGSPALLSLRWLMPTLPGASLRASFVAAPDTTYAITATPNLSKRALARAAATKRGSCTITLNAKQQRIATCSIRLKPAGRWLVAITPIRFGVRGTPVSKTVTIRATAPGHAEAVTG